VASDPKVTDFRILKMAEEYCFISITGKLRTIAHGFVEIKI